jgi:hypothetical protein
MEYIRFTLRLLLISKFQVNNRITGDKILDAMKGKVILRSQILLKCMMLMILCSCLDLEVQNLNAPDTERVLSDSDDIISVARGSVSLWYTNTQGLFPGLTLAVMADQNTATVANAAIHMMSSEPRQAWDNDKNARWADVLLDSWNSFYSVSSQNMDILYRLDGGIEVKGPDGTVINPMIEAMSYFVMGICHGYVALMFDQGYFLSKHTGTENPVFVSSENLMDSSLVYLDRALEICNSNPFRLGDGWINGKTYDNSEMSKIINSYAARLLISLPRNRSQVENVDWHRVRQYAENGIDFDLDPLSNWTNWVNMNAAYAMPEGEWARVDHRIINLMDPSFPPRWPSDNSSWDTPDGNPPQPADTSLDHRLVTDFRYADYHHFFETRGYEHFSNYILKKYDFAIPQNYTGFLPIFLKAENDLILAEALLRGEGDRTGAIAIINQGSRTLKGRLAPLPPDATEQEILEAIFYERDIELINTGLGISFFDMRRRDMLQYGTPLHFPVPGQDLELLFMENYTFGAGQGKPGEDYSVGGWF